VRLGLEGAFDMTAGPAAAGAPASSTSRLGRGGTLAWIVAAAAMKTGQDLWIAPQPTEQSSSEQKPFPYLHRSTNEMPCFLPMDAGSRMNPTSRDAWKSTCGHFRLPAM
jgi:hypothetical protein